MRWPAPLVAGCAVACAVALVAAADRPQFAAGVTLVEVYATVTGANGEAVTDLRKGEFTVFEEGVRQSISTFAAGDFPVSVAVAIDRSWSMAGEPLQLAKQAARTFLNQLRRADRAMVLAIASDTEVLAPLSADRTAAIGALALLQPWSSTELHDALIECLAAIQPTTGRRALIVLSDGIDRYSQATAADVLQRARESDVLVYPIALGERRSPLFAELAVQTGGRSFALQSPRDLERTFRAIAQELRYQYLLGYTPSRPVEAGPPEWRSIEVRVSRPGARVRARPGYRAR